MAKGLAQKILNDQELYSAGVRPEKAVCQYTVKVMLEIYPEIRHHIPASLSEFNHLHFDYVICFGQTAFRHCSDIFSKKSTEIIFYDVADPWNTKGSEEEIEIIYSNTRDQIRELLIEFRKRIS